MSVQQNSRQQDTTSSNCAQRIETFRSVLSLLTEIATQMDALKQIFDIIEKQDIHGLLTRGMPKEIEDHIKILCSIYQNVNNENLSALKSAITQKATPVILIFVSKMATAAMQNKDKDALDLGLIGLDLSNIMKVDSRDAYGLVARLAFASKQCGVDLVERATEVIRDLSPKLLKILQNPSPAKVTQDKNGNLIFPNPWRKDA